MSVGHVFLAAGLALELSGTLFISIDALRGQTQTNRIYDVLAFITGLELVDARTRPGDEEAGEATEKALARVPAGTGGELAHFAGQLEELNEMARILEEASETASQKNKEQLKEGLEKISDEFDSRKHLIAAAIATVVLGGICELVGGIVLG